MLFEEDIKNRVQNINLFEVVYKKGNFVYFQREEVAKALKYREEKLKQL